MSNDIINIDELIKKRNPSELKKWVEEKMDQVGSTVEGEKSLLLRKGLAKQFMEEVYPLSLFGWRKFGTTEHILLQPVIGNQNYDAIITNLETTPISESYVEITQSHEGESDYLQRLLLQKRGVVDMHSPIKKEGTKKTGMHISTPYHPKVVTTNEVAIKELEKIIDAARRKEGKDYPFNTSPVIVFNDGPFFRMAVNDAYLDTFSKKYILNMHLRFSALYLVGWQNIFREFNLEKKV